MKGIQYETFNNLTMKPMKPNQSRAGLTMTTIGALDLQEADGNCYTVGGRRV